MADADYLKSVDDRLILLTKKVDDMTILISTLVQLEKNQQNIVRRQDAQGTQIAELQDGLKPVNRIRSGISTAGLILCTALITAVANNYINKIFVGNGNGTVQRQDSSGGVKSVEDGKTPVSKRKPVSGN